MNAITKQRRALLRGIGTCLLAAFIAACATVPITGRHQLMLVSPAEESQLGFSEFEKMKKETKISHDPAINKLVQEVGNRIAAVAPLPGAKWEFVVFDDPKTPNAFCLPGGKVGVYTGILPITQDEVGLATVIGHEVSHAVARHGGERLSEGLATEFGGAMLGQAMRSNSARTQALVMGAYGAGSTLAVALPHSRGQESEADHLGLIYMARAGYDPHGAVDFWKRFAAYGQTHGGKPIAFLSTHPVDKVRIKQLEQWMPEAITEYEKAKGP